MAKFIVCSKDKHDNEKNRPVNLDLVKCINTEDGKVFAIRFELGDIAVGWYYGDRETRDKDYNEIIGKPESVIKVGDTVKVIDNTSDHEFDLGELVVVIGIGDDYRCKGERGDDWYLEINELELI